MNSFYKSFISLPGELNQISRKKNEKHFNKLLEIYRFFIDSSVLLSYRNELFDMTHLWKLPCVTTTEGVTQRFPIEAATMPSPVGAIINKLLPFLSQLATCGLCLCVE